MEVATPWAISRLLNNKRTTTRKPCSDWAVPAASMGEWLDSAVRDNLSHLSNHRHHVRPHAGLRHGSAS